MYRKTRGPPRITFLVQRTVDGVRVVLTGDAKWSDALRRDADKAAADALDAQHLRFHERGNARRYDRDPAHLGGGAA